MENSKTEHQPVEPAADEIERLAATEQRKLDELEAQATQLEAKAQAAAAAFKSDPSDKTALAERVSAQKALNKREEVSAFAQQSADLRQKAKRISDTRELERVRSLMSDATIIEEARENLEDATACFLKDARSALAELAEKVAGFNRQLPQRNALERAVGDGLQHGPLDFAFALKAASDALASTFGQIGSFTINRGVNFAYSATPPDQRRVEINLRLPFSDMDK